FGVLRLPGAQEIAHVHAEPVRERPDGGMVGRRLQIFHRLDVGASFLEQGESLARLGTAGVVIDGDFHPKRRCMSRRAAKERLRTNNVNIRARPRSRQPTAGGAENRAEEGFNIGNIFPILASSRTRTRTFASGGYEMKEFNGVGKAIVAGLVSAVL